MLENRHLPLIRAALKFFAEETAPHGINAMQPYFDPPPDKWPTVADIEQLRAWLRNCELKFVCCDANHARILDDRLFSTREDAETSAFAHSGQLASALCASENP